MSETRQANITSRPHGQTCYQAHITDAELQRCLLASVSHLYFGHRVCPTPAWCQADRDARTYQQMIDSSRKTFGCLSFFFICCCSCSTNLCFQDNVWLYICVSLPFVNFNDISGSETGGHQDFGGRLPGSQCNALRDLQRTACQIDENRK